MLIKTITYTDYNGAERTEKFYFNLTQTELLDLELDTPDGMEKLVKSLIEKNDNRAIIALVKKFLHKSYGVKSDDGKRLIKNDKVLEEFMQTEAYSKLFMELASDAEKSAAFFSGLVSGAPAAPAVKPVQG